MVYRCRYCSEQIPHTDSVCPKCGYNNGADTMEAVLAEMLRLYGQKEFLTRADMVNVFGDLAPELRDERLMLKYLYEVDGPTELFASIGRSSAEAQLLVNRVISRLKSKFISEEAAREICSRFLSVLGGSMPRIEEHSGEEEPPRKWMILAIVCAALLALVIGGIAAFGGQRMEKPTIAIPSSALTPSASTVSAENKCGLNAWWELENNVLTISGNGTMWDYDTGAEYSMYERTVENPITVPWYDKRDEIKKAVVEKGITNIGDHAFADCTNLESVEIPDSVTSIGEFAFSGTNLSGLELPNSVTYIGSGAFLGSTIVYMEIPEGVKTINIYTFVDCTSLERLILPEGLTSIEDAFDVCRQLGTVIIPDSVTYISDNAFSASCDMLVLRGKNGGYAQQYAQEHNLRFVPQEDSGSFLTGTKKKCGEDLSWTLKKGVLTISGKGPMEDYGTSYKIEEIPPWDDRASEIQKVKIKEGVTHIGINAFRGCFNISEIELPDSLLSIGDCAFAGCAKLSEVDLPDIIQTLGEGAFYECRSLSNVCLPESLQEVRRGAFYGSGLKRITFLNSLVMIDEFVFGFCRDLTEITIPDNVTSIGEGTFWYCNNLTEITIPDSVTEIGDWAFEGCDQLTIYGSEGSYTQSYARENRIPFVPYEGQTRG